MLPVRKFRCNVKNYSKVSILDRLWLKYFIQEPVKLPPSIGDRITNFLHHLLPLSLQQSLRDNGYMRFLFDASVTIAAALIGMLKPSVAKNFFTISYYLQSYRYGHTTSENIEVIENEEADSSKRRVLIFVHGGAWGSGRPWMYRLVSQALMSSLCTTHVAIVGYPVYPSASIQKQTRCLYKAIKYIRKRLFPSGDFVLCGHSSGANISALCLLQFFSESKLSYITKFVGLSGVYDIPKHYLWEKDRGVHEISPMKGAAGSITPRFIKCSPTILLALNTTGVMFPPTLLIHCEDDFVVPVSSTVEFALHLNRHGIKIDIFIPKSGGHSDFIFDLSLGVDIEKISICRPLSTSLAGNSKIVEYDNDADIITRKSEIEMYVVIETVRNQNIGTTLRCAVAFGATSLIIVGSDKVSTHGAHGSQHHLPILHFFYLEECKTYLRSKKCWIYAIVPPTETTKFSNVVNIQRVTYSGACAFVLASKFGLSMDQAGICDSLVSVAFPKKEFSRDVLYDVTVSIVLQHFTTLMQYQERHFTGEKFIVYETALRLRKVQKMSDRNMTFESSAIDHHFKAVDFLIRDASHAPEEEPFLLNFFGDSNGDLGFSDVPM